MSRDFVEMLSALSAAGVRFIVVARMRSRHTVRRGQPVTSIFGFKQHQKTRHVSSRR
jgi:hypothetical protein